MKTIYLQCKFTSQTFNRDPSNMTETLPAQNETGASPRLRSATNTIKFYDLLSIVFFVLAAASLSFLSLYLITDFVVIALGAMDIGTILNAASRMISLRTVPSNVRPQKAKNTVRL